MHLHSDRTCRTVSGWSDVFLRASSALCVLPGSTKPKLNWPLATSTGLASGPSTAAVGVAAGGILATTGATSVAGAAAIVGGSQSPWLAASTRPSFKTRIVGVSRNQSRASLTRPSSDTAPASGGRVGGRRVGGQFDERRRRAAAMVLLHGTPAVLRQPLLAVWATVAVQDDRPPAAAQAVAHVDVRKERPRLPQPRLGLEDDHLRVSDDPALRRERRRPIHRRQQRGRRRPGPARDTAPRQGGPVAQAQGQGRRFG